MGRSDFFRSFSDDFLDGAEVVRGESVCFGSGEGCCSVIVIGVIVGGGGVAVICSIHLSISAILFLTCWHIASRSKCMSWSVALGR